MRQSSFRVWTSSWHANFMDQYLKAHLSVSIIRETCRCIRGSRYPWTKDIFFFPLWEGGEGLVIFNQSSGGLWTWPPAVEWGLLQLLSKIRSSPLMPIFKSYFRIWIWDPALQTASFSLYIIIDINWQYGFFPGVAFRPCKTTSPFPWYTPLNIIRGSQKCSCLRNCFRFHKRGSPFQAETYVLDHFLPTPPQPMYNNTISFLPPSKTL